MPAAARLDDKVLGVTGGEHSGHTPPHSPMQFTGEISGNVSSNVFINGKAAAYVGSITTEKDGCCGSSPGSVGKGSSTVFINGKAAAREGDALNAHSGTGVIDSGSDNVIIGG